MNMRVTEDHGPYLKGEIVAMGGWQALAAEMEGWARRHDPRTAAQMRETR